jgi:hypothetical protein
MIAKISMNSTKIFIGFFMFIHLVVNVIIGFIVNDKANLNKGGFQGGPVQRCFTAHTIISVVVFLLVIGVMKNPLPIGPQILKQDLFGNGFTIISLPMIVHLLVSIIFTVLSFIEKDVTKVKNLSNIFNGVSSFVCSITIGLCFIPAETLIGLEEKAKAIRKKTQAKPVEKPVEAKQPEAKQPEAKQPEAKQPEAVTKPVEEVKPAKAAKEFGKRQRRRNPPKKRRRKKY